jgi:hypothetical protein
VAGFAFTSAKISPQNVERDTVRNTILLRSVSPKSLITGDEKRKLLEG